MSIQIFNNKQLIVNKDNAHQFSMDFEQVAIALGTTKFNISNIIKRHPEDFKENIQFGRITYCDSMNRTRERRILHKRGVMRVAMLSKSKVATKFRDWIEDLVIGIEEGSLAVVTLKDFNELKNLFTTQIGTLNNIIGNLEKQVVKNSLNNNLLAEKIDSLTEKEIKRIESYIKNILYAYKEKKVSSSYNSVFQSFRNEFKFDSYNEIPRTELFNVYIFLHAWLDEVKHGENVRKEQRWQAS